MQTSRAVATRQKILDSAIELFSNLGYANVGLNQITEHAQVTTGAFYHYFRDKEAVALAIRDLSWTKVADSFTSTLNSRTPGLERVITATFAMSDLMMNDPLVLLGHRLNQIVGLRTDEQLTGYAQRAQSFIDAASTALRPNDIRDGLSGSDVGSLAWVLLNGSHMLSVAMSDDVFARMAHGWLVLLHGIAPPESLAYFEQFVIRTADQYGCGEDLKPVR